MVAFVISRLLQALPVLLVVALISFALFTFVGDPVAAMLSQDASAADRENLVRLPGMPLISNDSICSRNKLPI